MRASVRADLLLLNPPFSQLGGKFEEYRDESISMVRVSRAMHFLLRALDLFRPERGAFAIVPESLMYSDLDAEGRANILSRFSLREVVGLKSTTFRGARVRSVAVQLLPNESPSKVVAAQVPARWSVDVERGTLQAHLACARRNGVPFVHSTDLTDFVRMGSSRMRVAPGRVRNKGWAILLPRVGVPSCRSTSALFVSEPVRLSDCVIGLWCRNKVEAKAIERTIHAHWFAFLDLYRGTGARFVTVSRLLSWLSSIEISGRRL